MILNMVGGGGDAGGGFPEFTYTGTYNLIDDGKSGGKQNWRLKLLSSGTLNFTKISGNLDVFLAGGGGSGGPDGWSSGGGGGYTKNIIGFVPTIGNNYPIIIGAGGAIATSHRGNDGGSTSAFGNSALGGKAGQNRDVAPPGKGGDGGCGGGAQCGNGSPTGGNGSGGSDGGNGQGGGNGDLGGIGQGTTTRAFGDINGELFCGGGSGTNAFLYGGTPGAGGGGTGGGSGSGTTDGTSGVTNTGGGGGGRRGAGGSGIVVIRNHRG